MVPELRLKASRPACTAKRPLGPPSHTLTAFRQLTHTHTHTHTHIQKQRERERETLIDTLTHTLSLSPPPPPPHSLTDHNVNVMTKDLVLY
jgi:hypothetical protein